MFPRTAAQKAAAAAQARADFERQMADMPPPSDPMWSDSTANADAATREAADARHAEGTAACLRRAAAAEREAAALANLQTADAAIRRRTYASRSGAARAARAACRRALGPAFCAFEGPDFELHTISTSDAETRHFYRLRGPAADAQEAPCPAPR